MARICEPGAAAGIMVGWRKQWESGEPAPLRELLGALRQTASIVSRRWNGGVAVTTIPIAISRYALLIATVLSLVAAEAASAKPASVNATTVPPVSVGDARIWIYRDYLPSESLNPATVSINGTETGYAQAAGGVFYRDVPPGHSAPAITSPI